MASDGKGELLGPYRSLSHDELYRYYEEEEEFQERQGSLGKPKELKVSVVGAERGGSPRPRRSLSRFFAEARRYGQAAGVACLLGASFFLGQRSMRGLERSYDIIARERDSLVVTTSYLFAENKAFAQMNDSLESLILKVSSQPLPSVVSSPARNARFSAKGYFSSYPIPPPAIDSLVIEDGRYVIEVDKEGQRLRVWRPANYALVADVPCSTGLSPGEKERSGDARTPSGFASIVSRQASGDWLFEGERAYGPLFFRLNLGSWDGKGGYDPDGLCSIAIHGTNEPEFLGSRRSHGCIRLPNDFLVLADEKGYLRPGNPVFIVPEEFSSLLASKHGLGEERVRNYSASSGEGHKKSFVLGGQ